jgi:uncharacterized Fe-S cluster-containing radical SAM superfamily protein
MQMCSNSFFWNQVVRDLICWRSRKSYFFFQHCGQASSVASQCFIGSAVLCAMVIFYFPTKEEEEELLPSERKELPSRVELLRLLPKPQQDELVENFLHASPHLSDVFALYITGFIWTSFTYLSATGFEELFRETFPDRVLEGWDEEEFQKLKSGDSDYRKQKGKAVRAKLAKWRKTARKKIESQNKTMQ